MSLLFSRTKTKCNQKSEGIPKRNGCYLSNCLKGQPNKEWDIRRYQAQYLHKCRINDEYPTTCMTPNKYNLNLSKTVKNTSTPSISTTYFWNYKPACKKAQPIQHIMYTYTNILIICCTTKTVLQLQGALVTRSTYL